MAIKQWVRALAVVAVWAWAVPVMAGPHLGMKLACKHYGDAWNSGSRGALLGQVTGDFGHVFQRMPGEMFASMPRGGGGQVLSHTKGNGSGRVTVSTSQGIMTFVVVGSGFNWRVADIYKAGDDGRTVSLKSYLDATVTAHEFIRDLKGRSDTAFYASISRSFRASWQDIDPAGMDLVREMIPQCAVVGKPFVSINGSRATMHVNLEGNRKATLQLVREGSWKIDDYAVAAPNTSIASFRNSVDTIAAVQRFRKFMVEPARHTPIAFTEEGMLRDSLVRVHEIGFLPMHQKPSKMTYFAIDSTGNHVDIKLEDRQVKLVMNREGQGARIAKAEITMGKRWADLSHLIALNEKIRTAIGYAGLAQPAIPVAAALAKEATLPVEPTPAVATPASKPIAPAVAITPIPSNLSEVRPAIKPASYSRSYQPAKRSYVGRPGRKVRFR